MLRETRVDCLARSDSGRYMRRAYCAITTRSPTLIAPRRRPERAEHEDAGDGHRAQHVHHAGEPRLEVGGDHALLAALLAALRDALGLVALAAERLDDAHRRQALGRERRDLPLPLALLARGEAHLAAVVGRDEAEHRRDRDHRHADQRVDQEADDDHPDQRQDRLGDRAEVLGEQRADRVRVAGEAGDEVALLAAVVVGERQALEMGVHLQAQLVRDALARPLEPQVARVRRERVEQRDAHHGSGDQEQRPQVGRGDREGDRAPRDEVVDQVLQRPRLRQVGERHQHRRRGRAAERAPVAPDDLPDQVVRATGARMGAVVVLGGCGVRGAAAEHRAIPARERASCTARLRHIPAREHRLRYASAGASASATRATSATSTGGAPLAPRTRAASNTSVHGPSSRVSRSTSGPPTSSQ